MTSTSFASPLILASAFFAMSASAHAQGPPDIVQLTNGGMLRGTISEYVPESHVLIVLPSGEERRVDAADVAYAGPAESAPSRSPTAASEPSAPPGPVAVSPPVPATAPSHPVHFESERDGLDIHHVVATGRLLNVRASGGHAEVWEEHIPIYDRLCTVPCNVPMQAGSYELGVSTGGNIWQPEQASLHVSGQTDVMVRWTDRSTTRWVGALVSLIGGIGGAALVPVGAAELIDTDDTVWQSVIGVGIALHVLSLAVGLPLAFWGDTFIVEQRPPAPTADTDGVP